MTRTSGGTPQRPADGERDVTEHLLAEHYLPVMRVCLRLLRDQGDAEDATQEVFRRAVQHSGRLQGDVLPWLLTVAKRVCIDELRRRRSERLAAERTEPPPGDAGPERVVVGHHFVLELLGRLTPAERRVMAQRVYRGANGVETGRDLGMSDSTARVLLARARQKLRRYLEEGEQRLALLPLLATRFLHGARRRLLLRSDLGEGPAALFLPAALALTVALSPVMPGSGGPTPDRPGGPPTAERPGLLHGGDTVDTTSVPTAVPRPASVARADSPLGGSASGTPLPPATDHFVFGPPDANEPVPWWVAASPDYPQDHTVLMTGLDSGTPSYLLYRSTDGGATWTWVNGAATVTSAAGALESDELTLPPDSFSQGRFYATGLGGLQMTTDNGAHWVSIAPSGFGWLGAAPAQSGLGVVVSNYALWRLTRAIAPTPMTTFPGHMEAVGNPLIIPVGGGYDILQPASPISVSIVPDQVLHCQPTGCTSSTPLPLNGNLIRLIPSPSLAVDHTIYAMDAGNGLAVSHDDGRSFTFVGAMPIEQLAVAPSPRGGLRLVAAMGLDIDRALQYSDDDGHTWTDAAIDPATMAISPQTVTLLRPGRLLITTARTDRSGRYDFLCSTDGSWWSTCRPDTGP